MHAERYIAQTRAGHERKVRARLALRGIPAIAPCTRRFESRRGKQTHLVVGPATPGYMYPRTVLSVLSEALPDIEGACRRPLMVGGKVRAMSKPERARLAEILRDPPLDPRDPYPQGKPDAKKPPFRPGQEVVVTRGPFATFKAVVDRAWLASKCWRVNAEVMIFGRPTPVDFDAGSLVAA